MNWSSWQPQDPALITGFTLWRSGKPQEALLFFERFLSEHAGDPDALRGCGSVLWTLGRFNEALERFRRAVYVDCWNPMHWSNLGLAYRDLKRPVEAIHSFEVAVALDPSYEPAFNEWANVLVDCRRYAEALVLYERALSLDPSRAVVYHNRGVCLRLMGQIEAAIRSLRQAQELDPGYGYTIQELQNLTGVRRAKDWQAGCESDGK